MNSVKKMYVIALLIPAAFFVLTNICPGESVVVKKYQKETLYPKHYPQRFDGMGRIDRLSRNEIVIDDSHFRLSPRVTFSTKVKEHASRAWLKVGSYIGYKADSKNKHEIISIWLIE